jgi:hypothetical protein
VTELRRLLESSDDDVERALLDAVRAERPHASGLRSTALALGLTVSTANALAATLPAASACGSALGVEAASAVFPVGSSGGVVASAAATTSASGNVAALGSVSLGVLGKSLLGGTLVSFLALTTLDQTLGLAPNQASSSRTASSARPASHGRPPAAVPAAAVIASAAATSVPEPLPSANTSRSVDNRRALARLLEPAPVAEAVPVDRAPATATFAPLAQPQIAPGAAAAASASLTAEIRLLDRARAALTAGDTVTAGRLLDAYASNRPSSVLTQEAGLLRVKLLLARGQRSAAAQLARQILATQPESSHADSLRRLAAEP